MTRSELLQFMRSHRHAVEASVNATGSPQAAVVGIAVDDNFGIIFDTIETTRKIQNLRRNGRISLVIGGINEGDERTVQYEGLADEPQGEELELLRKIYFAAFPEGPERLSWPGITHVRVRPRWIRFSDYSVDPPNIIEFDTEKLRDLR